MHPPPTIQKFSLSIFHLVAPPLMVAAKAIQAALKPESQPFSTRTMKPPHPSKPSGLFYMPFTSLPPMFGLDFQSIRPMSWFGLGIRCDSRTHVGAICLGLHTKGQTARSN